MRSLHLCPRMVTAVTSQSPSGRTACARHISSTIRQHQLAICVVASATELPTQQTICSLWRAQLAHRQRLHVLYMQARLGPHLPKRMADMSAQMQLPGVSQRLSVILWPTHAPFNMNAAQPLLWGHACSTSGLPRDALLQCDETRLWRREPLRIPALRPCVSVPTLNIQVSGNEKGVIDCKCGQPAGAPYAH